jgi:hypothetical protein
MKQLRALSQPLAVCRPPPLGAALLLSGVQKSLSARAGKERSAKERCFSLHVFFPRSLHSTLVTRPSFHLITLSALASTLGGIVRPICFAVLRLMMNSNLIGCSTGSSAGLAPFRILSTYVAARLKLSISLVE